MLSVIVVKGDPDRLAGLLAALTPAAVEGLVREVLIVTEGPADLLRAVCDHTGAERLESLAAAIGAARSDMLMLAEPGFRPREGWVERLADHLRQGGRAARLNGLRQSWVKRAPCALLIERDTAMKSNDFSAMTRSVRRSPKLA